MEKFYDKLRVMEPKQIKIIQIISGGITGVIVWLAIMFSSNTTDKLLSWVFVGVFLAVMLIQNLIRTKAEWDTKTFKFALIYGIGAGMVVFLVEGIITGKIFS